MSDKNLACPNHNVGIHTAYCATLSLEDRQRKLEVITDDELAAEVARRSKIKEEIPKPIKNIDWQPLLDYFNRTLLQMSRGEGVPKEFEHWVFEKVAEVAYDERKFFKWWDAHVID